MKKFLLLVCAIVVLSLGLVACGSKETSNNDGGSSTQTEVKYPTKPIKIVIMAPEGASGLNTFARKIGSIIQEQNGWQFEYVNMPDTGSGDSVKAVLNAPHDGHTLLSRAQKLIGFEMGGVIQGTIKDWANFEVLQEPNVIFAKADSAYKTFDDLMKAAKANSGSVRLGMYGGKYQAYYLKYLALKKMAGVEFKEVECASGAEISNAFKNNQIDAAILPNSVLLNDLKSGAVKPLVVTDANPYNFGGTIGAVESITKFYPDFKKYLPLDDIIGLCMPADAPKEAKEAFGKAFEQAVNTEAIADMIKEINATKLNLTGENGDNYMKDLESVYAWTAKELGLATVDPEKLGIAKPARFQ